MGEEAKLSTKNPSFWAYVEIVEALEPLERLDQLKALAAACTMNGEYTFAAKFTKLAEQAERQLARQQPGDGQEKKR